MNKAAKSVMRELSSDITLAYGDSDEYRYPYPHRRAYMEFSVDPGVSIV